MKRTQKGFTLIELLVVISIIGLLSSVVLASLSTARIKAANAATTSQIREYQKALALFYADNGRYPITGTPGSVVCLGPNGTTCVVANVTVTNTIASMGELATLEKLNPNLAKKENHILPIAYAANLSTYIPITAVKTPQVIISGQAFSGGYYMCASGDSQCKDSNVYWPNQSTTVSGSTNGTIYKQKADGSDSIIAGSSY